jgi:hypothetical protein
MVPTLQVKIYPVPADRNNDEVGLLAAGRPGYTGLDGPAGGKQLYNFLI